MKKQKLFRSFGKAISEVSFIIDHAISSMITPSDSIFVSGFWRSGTTWLQQCLAAFAGAKTIFEPLNPLNEYFTKNNADDRKIVEPFRTVLSPAFMPFGENDLLSYPELHSMLSRALTGDLRGHLVRKARKSLWKSLKKKIVVKDVRCQLCLNAIERQFSPTIFHIHRDPRAIIASIKRDNWWHGWLDNLSLRELLISPDDGRRSFLSEWHDAILHYENKSNIEKIAAYWAITELSVQKFIVNNGARINLVSYEKLLDKPEEYFKEVIYKVYGCNIRCEQVDLSLVSPTTKLKRRNATSEERGGSWKYELTLSEIDAIEKAVQRFGLVERLF